MATTRVPFSFLPLVFSRHLHAKLNLHCLFASLTCVRSPPEGLSPFFLGVTCEDFLPEIRFATLNTSHKILQLKLNLMQKRLNERNSSNREPRDCKSLLTGRTCTRDDFVSRQLLASNPAIECFCEV